MSFSYKLLELLKKQAADNNKNGVVGNKGTKIPIIPNVNDNKPNIVNIIFIFFSSQSSKLNGSKFKSSSHSISPFSYTYSILWRAVLRRESLLSIPIGHRC